MAINQNQALFSLLGTTYGGDGRVTFGLPELRGQVPIHMGAGFTLGQKGGEENHTLTIGELPTHSHVANASSLDGDQAVANNNLLAGTATTQLYDSNATNLTSLLPSSIANVGGSQPHPNMQPFLTLNFCIALQGIFPSRN
jgi:microcystin-dependent protein